MGSGGTEDAEPRLWMCHEHPAHSHVLVWGFSRMDTTGLLGRESSVVWIHASNVGCFGGREEPECCFWVTCKVLRGTGLVA